MMSVRADLLPASLMSTPRMWVAATVACAAGAVLFTVPWRPNEETVPAPYRGEGETLARLDVSHWAYSFGWGARHPDRFYDAPVLLPLPSPLCATDPRLTEGLWSAPLFRSAPPLVAWGAVLWISLAATALASYAAGRFLSGSAWGGAGAAVLWGFGAHQAVHLPHLEIVFQPWLPLALAALAAYLEAPTLRRAGMLGLAAALAAIENAYAALALALALPPALAWGARRLGIGWGRAVLPLVAAGAIAGVVLLPVMARYRAFRAATGLERTIDEVDLFGAAADAWLTGPDGRVLPFFFGDGRGEGAFFPNQRLFPGFVAGAVGIAGLAALRRRSPEILVVGAVGLLLSFGTMRLLLWRLGVPDLHVPTPYEILYALFFPLRAIRAPGKFALLPHLALALAGALAVAALARRGRGGRAAAAALLAFAFLEARMGVHEVRVRPDRAADPAYAWIASRPEAGAVLDAPMGRSGVPAGDLLEAEALFAAAVHGRPTPNGMIATRIPWHEAIAVHLARPRPGETVEILRALGVRWVVARDSATAAAFEAAGLRPVEAAPAGSAVLLVESPLEIPRTPAEMQSRLASLPHARVPSGDVFLAGVVEAPARVSARAGRLFWIEAVVRNDGPETWCADGALTGLGPRGDVRLGVRNWRGAGGAAEDRPLELRGRPLERRGLLPADVAPGETAAVPALLLAPRRPGLYRAEAGLVAEEIRWFGATAAIEIEVVP